MARPIKMPDLGATVDSITLLQWRVKPGDAVKRGDPLAEIESDKAISVLESVAEGTVLKLSARDGDVVKVGQVIAYVGQAGESVPDETGPAAAGPRPPAAAPSAARKGAPGLPPVPPLVRNLAQAKGVDLSRVKGTGPGGVITRQDVLAAARNLENSE